MNLLRFFWGKVEVLRATSFKLFHYWIQVKMTLQDAPSENGHRLSLERFLAQLNVVCLCEPAHTNPRSEVKAAK
jgi:hypothetical protein